MNGKLHEISKQFDTSTAVGRVFESFRLLCEKQYRLPQTESRTVFLEMKELIDNSPLTLTESEYIEFRKYVSYCFKSVCNKYTWVF